MREFRGKTPEPKTGTTPLPKVCATLRSRHAHAHPTKPYAKAHDEQNPAHVVPDRAVEMRFDICVSHVNYFTGDLKGKNWGPRPEKPFYPHFVRACPVKTQGHLTRELSRQNLQDGRGPPSRTNRIADLVPACGVETHMNISQEQFEVPGTKGHPDLTSFVGNLCTMSLCPLDELGPRIRVLKTTRQRHAQPCSG